MIYSMLTRANDIKAKYMSMGDWKSKSISKKSRGSQTASKKCRTYVAIPPIGGWLGGRPEDNGFRLGRG